MSFIQDYFIQPILKDSGYNPLNTLFYAILAIIILYGFYKLAKYLKLKVDFKLFLATIPFIIFGAMMRSFVDHNYFTMTRFLQFLLISPGIWLLSVSLFMLAFGVSYLSYKKYNLDMWKMTSLFGSLAILFGIGLVYSKLAFNQWFGVGVVLSIFIGLCIAIYLVGKHYKIHAFIAPLGFATIASQSWDAVNTSTILSIYGGSEKHFVPRWIIANFGPWSFLLVKLAILLPAVYLIYKHVEDKLLRNTFLIGIAIFGLGQGSRNFISMLLA